MLIQPVSLVLGLVIATPPHPPPHPLFLSLRFVVVWGSWRSVCVCVCVHLCSVVMHGSSTWFGVTLEQKGAPSVLTFCPPLPLALSLSLSLSRCCSLIVNNSQLRLLVVQIRVNDGLWIHSFTWLRERPKASSIAALLVSGFVPNVPDWVNQSYKVNECIFKQSLVSVAVTGDFLFHLCVDLSTVLYFVDYSHKKTLRQ